MNLRPASKLKPGQFIEPKPGSAERAEILEVRAVNGKVWVDLDNDDVLFFKPSQTLMTWTSRTGGDS